MKSGIQRKADFENMEKSYHINKKINQKNNNNQEETNQKKTTNQRKKTCQKKQLANTSPTEYSEKEMKKQVGCVMLNLR